MDRKQLDVLHMKGKCDKVVELLKPLLDQERIKQPGLLFVLARCLADTTRYEASLRVLSDLLKYDPEHGKGWALKYWLHYHLGQDDQASACLEHLEFLGWTEEMIEQVRPNIPHKRDIEPQRRGIQNTPQELASESCKENLRDQIENPDALVDEGFPWHEALVQSSLVEFIRENMQPTPVWYGFLSLFL